MAWPTLEVRWFFRGACPDEVGRWFDGAGEDGGSPEERIDDYLIIGRDDLGIKTRGGLQLDVKLKTGDGPDIALPTGMAGRVELWTKWSFGLDTMTPPTGAWMRVEKRRLLRRYSFANGVAGLVGADELVPLGCAAELVEVGIDGIPSWGFGFEAFGDEPRRPDALIAVAVRIVGELGTPPVVFGLADSHSYPSWLCAVGSR